MKRFTGAAVLMAVMMMVAVPAMAEQKKVRWKLAMTWGSTLTPLSDSGPILAKMVSDMTGGNFEIRAKVQRSTRRL